MNGMNNHEMLGLKLSSARPAELNFAIRFNLIITLRSGNVLRLENYRLAQGSNFGGDNWWLARPDLCLFGRSGNNGRLQCLNPGLDPVDPDSWFTFNEQAFSRDWVNVLLAYMTHEDSP